MARIIVGSYVVRFPVGGYLSWTLQWLWGFKRLGHDVYLVEKAAYPDACFNPMTRMSSDDCTYGVAVLRDFLARYGLEDRWCFVDAAGAYHGLSRKRIEQLFQGADLFIDMGSHGTWVEEAAGCGLRVYIDGEPGFRQMLWCKLLEEGKQLPEYDRYYTVGANIGTIASAAPTANLAWRSIFDPVIVDLYTCEPAPKEAPFTTVMSWQAHAPLEFDGKVYGQKDVEFMNFVELPRLSRVPMEIAVSGKAPIKRLIECGWRVRDSIEVTLTFDAWKNYIAMSRGEFSVCKNVFVATNSGFFSDRSAAYLASGRPVVMQDTGFSRHLPCGSGLFAVRTADEASAAIDLIAADYTRHARVAREIACEYLEASRVLGNLLGELGVDCD